MYSIAQLFLRFFGIGLIVFSILLSTDIGEAFFVEDLKLPIKNSMVRIILGIENDVANAENIRPENNEQPIFGIFDIKSFIFILFMLSGFLFLAVDISQLGFIFKEGILRSPVKLRNQMLLLTRRLKSMSEAYYQRGASQISEGINVNKMPRAWPVLIENIQLKIPFYDILNIMGNEAGLVRKQYDLQIKTINMLSNISPSLGVIGTVLGLIKLLYNLSDPTNLGPSMALALLTTLYGLFFSVIIIKPIAVRLENIKTMQMDAFQIAAFWIGLLAEGKPPYYTEQRFLKRGKNMNVAAAKSS